jgi:hypothetical protein
MEVNGSRIDSKNNQGSKRVKYMGSASEKLIQFYNNHNRSKLDYADPTLKKHALKEEELFKNLAKQYGVYSIVVFGVGKSSTTFMSTAGGTFALYAGFVEAEVIDSKQIAFC